MAYISVTNWSGPEGFQHYKDRGPKWIKVYTALLSDDDYLELTGNRRAILQGIWLEYARSGCALRDDTAVLSRRFSLKVVRPDLDALVHAGFIAIVASKSLADGYQSASASRALAREEAETEEEKKRPRPTTVPLPQPEAKTTGGGHGDGSEDERNSRPNIEPDDSMGSLDPADELMRTRFGGG